MTSLSYRVFPLSHYLLASIIATACAPEARADEHIFATSSNPWLRDVTLSGLLDGGITANPARPHDSINVGNVIGERANQAQLNQFELTLEKITNPTIPVYQIGFTLQGMYGSDPRYLHPFGAPKHLIKGRYQLVPAQAHIDVHLPLLTKNGIDLQAGILQSPMGSEPFDPLTRPFYTLAYTTQYSEPVEHIGAMAYWHINPTLNIDVGIDSGNQTTIGQNNNHSAAAGYIGFSLNNLAHDKLNITGMSRIGPESTTNRHGDPKKAQRYWNDLFASYAVTDKLVMTGDINFLHDDGIHANAFGLFSLLNYKLSSSFDLNYRGEIYRDTSGLITGSTTPSGAPLPTTFGALTLSITYKPTLGHDIHIFEIRPEIRFDRALNGRRIFNDHRNMGMFTFGGDMMIGF